MLTPTSQLPIGQNYLSKISRQWGLSCARTKSTWVKIGTWRIVLGNSMARTLDPNLLSLSQSFPLYFSISIQFYFLFVAIFDAEFCDVIFWCKNSLILRISPLKSRKNWPLSTQQELSSGSAPQQIDNILTKVIDIWLHYPLGYALLCSGS